MAEANGKAVGAGHELPAQIDMRFAGPKAHAGPTENALGLFGEQRPGHGVRLGRQDIRRTHRRRDRLVQPLLRDPGGIDQRRRRTRSAHRSVPRRRSQRNESLLELPEPASVGLRR